MGGRCKGRAGFRRPEPKDLIPLRSEAGGYRLGRATVWGEGVSGWCRGWEAEFSKTLRCQGALADEERSMQTLSGHFASKANTAALRFASHFPFPQRKMGGGSRVITLPLISSNTSRMLQDLAPKSYNCCHKSQRWQVRLDDL